MIRPTLLAPLLAICFVACGHESDHGSCTHDHGSAPHSHVLMDEAQWSHHGHGVHAGDTFPIEDVLAAPTDFVGRTVRIGGRVAAVCQESGSWLRLGEADRNVLVRFADSAFTVPIDAAGEAIVEGVVEPAAEIGGHAAGGPEPLAIVATGVALAVGD